MKRLFVAIDLDEAIALALFELDPRLRGVRWLRPEQMHLTLSFLGNVSPGVEETLREKLGAIHFGPFFLPIVGIGVFPAKSRPNVIWAGVGAGHPHLFQLHKRVQEAALAAGLEPDLRSFHPHITIARCKEVSAESVRPFLKAHADLDLGLVRIERFSLYSSRPGPFGSVYTQELEVSASI
jgi:2'-5' RNA ligase